MSFDILTVTLPKSTDAVGVAQELAHRAALHWFAPGKATTADDRAALEKLVSPPRLRPEAKKFAF